MDAKDVRILSAVGELGSGSPEKIHEETGIPASTVHYRLQRMHKEGIIVNDIFDVDRDALGFSLTVISEVNAEYEEGYHEEVGQRLSEIDGVNQVYFVMGDTDFIVISHLSSHDMVEDLVSSFEAIDEVQRTSSKFAIQTIKDSSSIYEDYDESVLLSELTED